MRKKLAALPGAPSMVSAAGLTPPNVRLLTLERTDRVPAPVRRLVIVGGLDGTAESATVLANRYPGSPAISYISAMALWAGVEIDALRRR